MKNPLPSIYCVTFLVLLVSCTRQPAVDISAEVAALREADNRYSRTGTTKDLEAFVSLNAPDCAMYPPQAPIVKGLDSIRSFVTTAFKDPLFSIKFTPVAVEVSQGGDMGYTLNLAELTSTGPNGEAATEHLRDFHVWRKQADGSWKIEVDIWNAEPPSAPAMKK